MKKKIWTTTNIILLAINTLANVYSYRIIGILSITLLIAFYIFNHKDLQLIFLIETLPFARTIYIPGLPNIFPILLLTYSTILLIKIKNISSSSLILSGILLVISIINFKLQFVFQNIVWWSQIAFYILIISTSEKIKLLDTIKYYIYSFVFATIIAYIFKDVRLFVTGETNISFDSFSTERFGGLIGNPVGFVREAIIYISVGIILIKDRKESGILLKISIVLLVLFGFMTLSKTYILLLPIILILYLYINKSFRAYLFFAILIILFVFVFKILLIEYYKIFVFRFTASSEGFDSNRTSIVTSYIKVIPKYLKYLIIGFGTDLNYYKDIGLDYLPHNIFIDTLFSVGIIGSLVIFIIVIKELIRRRKNSIYIIPILLLIISSLSINIIGSLFTPYTLFLLLGVYRYENKSTSANWNVSNNTKP